MGGLRRLRREERMEIYKLLLSYAVRFSDSENQLLYLRKLEEMHLEEGESAQNQMELLSLRKSLAKLYAQMHMESESAEVLLEIKVRPARPRPCSRSSSGPAANPSARRRACSNSSARRTTARTLASSGCARRSSSAPTRPCSPSPDIG